MSFLQLLGRPAQLLLLLALSPTLIAQAGK